MNDTWHSLDSEPKIDSPGFRGWLRVLRRGVPMVLVLLVGLVVLLALRLVERPLFGLRRPITPRITQSVCRICLWLMGVRYQVAGAPLTGQGAVVANHSGWLDIFTLNAAQRVYFVSKDEVAGWPGIGGLARATGTMFIKRDRREAMAQTQEMQKRLHLGQRLLFFPEGTSTDGRRVLPFKSTLFAPFFADGVDPDFAVQPVSVLYHPPAGADPRLYGWWGDMEFGAHLLQTLAVQRQGHIVVQQHPPLRVADYPDRRSLSRACEMQVRQGLDQAGLLEISSKPVA